MGNQSHRKNDPDGDPSQGGTLGRLDSGGTSGNDEVLGNLSDALNDAPVIGQRNPPAPAPNSGAGGDLDDLLGGLFGTAGAQRQNPQGGSGDPLSDMLGSLLGGGGGGMPSQSGMPGGGTSRGSSGDPLSDLLGSLLGGGGGGMPSGGSGQANDPLGGLLGGLMGGMTGSGMGSGASNTGGMNSILAPLADLLAAKTGISRDLALSVMAVVVPMVMSKIMQSGQALGNDPMLAMQSGESLNFTRNEQAEMVQQLSNQTGLDQQAAAQTLSQAIQVLGSQR